MSVRGGTVTATPTPPARAGGAPPLARPLLTEVEAAAWLKMSPRHLRDRVDIPRCDMSAPGARLPMWRYRIVDLEALAESHLVNSDRRTA